jgi:DNA-binding Lrp family transcriptional regulator
VRIRSVYDRFVIRDGSGPDTIDQKLLDLLADNARLPATTLGEVVGLSPSAVRKRLRDLEGTYILKYTTVLAPGVSGRAEAYVEVMMTPKADVHAFVERVVKMDGVREASQISGKPDAILRLRAETNERIGDVVNKIRKLREVDDTKTLVIVHRQRNVSGGHGGIRETS